jgi:tRNA threonylcarbamoyladenosine biosynthesis protein TsaB
VLVLAFDASTADVAVAVARAGPEGKREVLAEVSVPSRGASEALLPAVHAALGLAGEDLEGVDRVLVGVGPGTFTGIRIAAAAARSLALATGAPLSAVSTLDALAAPARLSVEDSVPVLAVLDARRRQVFARRYGAGGPRGPILCAYPDDLLDEGAPLVVGDGAVRYRAALSPLGFVPPDGSPLHRVTGAGLVLASDLRPVPAEEVVPIYVREPDAEARRDLNPWSRP